MPLPRPPVQYASLDRPSVQRGLLLPNPNRPPYKKLRGPPPPPPGNTDPAFGVTSTIRPDRGSPTGQLFINESERVDRPQGTTEVGVPTQVRNRRHYHNSRSRNVTAGPRPISPGRPDRAGPGPATTRRPRRHGAQAPPRWHSDPVCLALLRGKTRSSFHKRTTFLSPTSHLTRSSPGFGSR